MKGNPDYCTDVPLAGCATIKCCSGLKCVSTGTDCGWVCVIDNEE